MKVGLVSLGCPKNLVDSEVMLGLLQQAGHELTPDATGADVLVVNTCAFIDAAKQESIDAILEMAEEKRTGSCRRLVVTGCLAERYREELCREIPEIDAALGTGDIPAIVRAVEASEADVDSVPLRFFRSVPGTAAPIRSARGSSVLDPGHSTFDPRPSSLDPQPRALPTYIYDADTPRTLTTPGHYAYVKVAEGCDYTCAFCIIPTLRGSYRSRPAGSIVQEARLLAARGVRELILISQDTTFYGIDRGERGAIGRLLRDLDSVDGLEWVRLLYLYPTTISDDMLDAMARSATACKYVDLPLQHASAAVLRRMRRPGNRAKYERLIARIRARVPGVALRTTFIVGFPGETEEEFVELLDFVETVRFDHVGVFTYSHEEGTAAHAVEDDVPAPEKRRRRDRLMRLQKRIVTDRHRGRRGEIVQVRVDRAADGLGLVLQGRLAGQAPDIDPVVYLADCDPSRYRPGELIKARITGARGYDLVAAPLL